MIRSTGSISNTNVYLKYAEEALRWSYQAKTEHSKKAFLDLAHTWARAAKHPEAPWVQKDDAPMPKTL